MKKKFKYIGVTVVTILFLALIGIFIWTSNTYKPSDVLTSLVTNSDYKKVDDFYVFIPKVEAKEVGIVLYPGALVEPLSYGYIANELSKQGYLVAIPDVNLNLSITENNKADEFIKKHEEIKDWYVGGHSMGGVSASMYAENNIDKVDGVILLASYPSESTNLSDNNQKVISVFAEFDGLATIDKIEKSKKNLPSDTEFLEIDGGNHAQFGVYGEQKGDNKATIDVVNQQNQIISGIITFLNN